MNDTTGVPPAGLLKEALAGVELPLTDEVFGQLTRLFEMLQAWKGSGIVGFRSPEDLARYYFREALLLQGILPNQQPEEQPEQGLNQEPEQAPGQQPGQQPGRGLYLDVGSGGGTPALPLALAGGGEWILLEPRRAAAAFLEMATEALGLTRRVRIVRQRLKDFLKSEAGQATLPGVSAVTMRAVKLRSTEWTMLAAGLAAGTPVIWPTSRPARQRAELGGDLFDEDFITAERGVVWIGRPHRDALT